MLTALVKKKLPRTKHFTTETLAERCKSDISDRRQLYNAIAALKRQGVIEGVRYGVYRRAA